MCLALGRGMKFALSAVRNTVGLVMGLGFGLIVTSPTVSAFGTLPSLSLMSPANGSNVSGTLMFVAMADSAGLASLQFTVDGNNYGSAIVAGSCRTSFDTTSASDGPHSIQAVGHDGFGNTVVSMPATIFVNNLAPAVSGIFVSNVTTSSATISWNTAALCTRRL